MHPPRQNPRLNAFFADADRLLNQPTPMHESRYVATMADFMSWMNDVWDPKIEALQTLLSELESLQQRLHSFAEISAVTGPAGYHFLTPHLELGDVLDLLLCVERRAEQIYQDLLTMDELRISLEATANATECYNHNNWDGARSLDDWKESSQLAAKGTFHSKRTARKWDLAAKLSNYYATAEKTNTPPYDAIMLELSRIESLTSSPRNEHDRGVLERALTILRVLKDQGCYACSLSWKARSEAMQQDEVFARLETEATIATGHELREALLQRQREIIEENEGQAERANKAVTEHYMQYGEAPIMRLLGELNANSNYPTATATATAGSTEVVTTPPQSARPSFQMPLSWYSDMLTSSHVVS
jgi:hypothetical protein